MERLTVLCAAMGQPDFSLIEHMNLRSDVIIANQAERNEYAACDFDGHHAELLTTATRGVGRNRNLSLLAARSELLLFADEDVTYNADYAERVVRAFDELPQASVIIFGIDTVKNGSVIQSQTMKTRRAHLWNVLRYGACAIAVRRADILRENISFTLLFGGGARYSSGEDSLFLRECLAKKLKIYTYDYCLGTTCADHSTWFEGFREKYFYDKGAWIAAAFPGCKRLMNWIFFLKFRKRAEIPEKNALRLMRAGLRGYRTLTPYKKAADRTER